MNEASQIRYVVIYCIVPIRDKKLSICEIVYENADRIYFTYEMDNDANKNLVGLGNDSYNYLSFYYKFFSSNRFSFLHESVLIENIEICERKRGYVYIFPTLLSKEGFYYK